MHFLCSPLGSAGDIYPFLGVALALKRRGHRVTFLVNGYFRDVVQRHAIEFEELGRAEDLMAAIQNPELWHPVRSIPHVYRHLVEPILRQQYEAFARRFQPGETVGITDSHGLGALVAQDKLGLPVVTVHCQPAAIWSDVEPPNLPGQFGPGWIRRLLNRVGEIAILNPVIKPSLNSLRTELGLDPIDEVAPWSHSRWCVACLFPEWFCPPQEDWPKNLIQTDFPLWDDHEQHELPKEVESFLADGDPPIVFTPGSANIFGKEFFAAAVDACRRLNRRGLLLTRFEEQIPAELPRGVVWFPYVPFDLLLRRAAAVVHHGGVGSAAEGLAAGIPQLVMPMAYDQFDNADRLQRLGVGDWIKKSRFTGETVAGALDRLLSSPAVAESCASTKKRVRRDGCERTAAALEAKASDGYSSSACKSASR